MTEKQKEMAKKLEAYGYLPEAGNVWRTYNQDTDAMATARANADGTWTFIRTSKEKSEGLWFEATDQTVL